MNIDLTKYKLVQPSNIKLIKSKISMYDITIKDDHTFHIYLNENTKLLAHNCDGQHISALIISFFHKWFPQIIESKKLYRIITPLVVCTLGKDRKYFYTLKEYEEFISTTKVTNVNYLKGLGSLNIEDWENVMKNKILFSVIDDRSAGRFLEIAFGDNSEKRKRWLSGK
jgi:DNA gyrase/topoisomerase IV subunit B